MSDTKPTRKLIYRRTEPSALSSEEIGRQIDDLPGATVVDRKDRMILVEVEESLPSPKFDGWTDFETQRYAVPDARPKIEK